MAGLSSSRMSMSASAMAGPGTCAQRSASRYRRSSASSGSVRRLASSTALLRIRERWFGFSRRMFSSAARMARSASKISSRSFSAFILPPSSYYALRFALVFASRFEKFIFSEHHQCIEDLDGDVHVLRCDLLIEPFREAHVSAQLIAAPRAADELEDLCRIERGIVSKV